MVKRPLRKKPERRNSEFKATIINMEVNPNLESNYYSNDNSNEKGSRFFVLNDDDSDDSSNEKENMIHEDSHRETMQNGPVETKIIKPGAGKNPQAHKKWPLAKTSPPSSTENSRGKGKVGEPEPTTNLVVVDATTTILPTKPSEEEREIRRQQEAQMLEDIRKLKQNPHIALEASKMVPDILNSFVVKNSFLNQRPLSSERVVSIDTTLETTSHGDLNAKPPDPYIIDSQNHNLAMMQVNIDHDRAQELTTTSS
ncbi:hypothetical protein PIB30_077495 [Stylosanthes scabra]|uniref:Uncharacterized protein n=1 Tax=Stylosanthes scabra TaxID=79078 RepID=A0ABU6YN61_9FABA|nr:hypothetical protein [Stylosanthes scabra]